VGEDEEVSIKEVADAIVKAVGFQGHYSVCFPSPPPFSYSFQTQFDTTRSDGQFRKPASNKKLLNLIGGFQFTPFEEGMAMLYWCVVAIDSPLYCLALDETVKWFIENYETSRTGNVNERAQH
jgi:GDP-L-fucose synthase